MRGPHTTPADPQAQEYLANRDRFTANVTSIGGLIDRAAAELRELRAEKAEMRTMLVDLVAAATHCGDGESPIVIRAHAVLAKVSP